VGLKLGGRNFLAARKVKPQSNQRGIETMVLCFEVPLGLARLNRTSVGLKHDNIKLRTQKS